mmetsp:Transcript_44545/g.53904  ORF Transcript_44545/g.53904 Transcript_44545/m.53904 type:complete len:347 (+) Transcript_44545:456-1496(+)
MIGLAAPDAALIFVEAFLADAFAFALVPEISLYVFNICSISRHAFSLWMDLRGGSPVCRMEGNSASNAPTAYSADIASGTYLEPPSASSAVASTRSEITCRQSATAEGTARHFVLLSPSPESAAAAASDRSLKAFVAVYSLNTPYAYCPSLPFFSTMFVINSDTAFAAGAPPSGKAFHGASRKAQAIVALRPCRSPSDIIGFTTLTASDSISASRDTGHCAKFKTTKRLKSSRLLLVQRDGGAVVALIFSTTHLGMSVLPNKRAFSSLFARFLIKPHAQRTPSLFPLPDFGTDGVFVRSFSRTRIKEFGLSRGATGSAPSATGECWRMVVILASRKDKFIKQMQHK